MTSSQPDLSLNSYNRVIQVEPVYEFAYFCRAATNADLGEDGLARADSKKVLAASNNAQL
jgi:hypothetical protein